MFVYGTLRKGMYNYEKYYKAHDSFRGYGYVKGELHAIKGKEYPALIEGERMILGEIHEVPAEVQDAVDLMEGFYGEGRMENEYDKIVSIIYNAEGEVMGELPVYFYNLRNLNNGRALGDVILCDDYIKYLQEASDH
ncbi:MAG: gamma-glutamylcyclotransferase [Lachnospiraceae bacterium]